MPTGLPRELVVGDAEGSTPTLRFRGLSICLFAPLGRVPHLPARLLGPGALTPRPSGQRRRQDWEGHTPSGQGPVGRPTGCWPLLCGVGGREG